MDYPITEQQSREGRLLVSLASGGSQIMTAGRHPLQDRLARECRVVVRYGSKANVKQIRRGGCFMQEADSVTIDDVIKKLLSNTK